MLIDWKNEHGPIAFNARTLEWSKSKTKLLYGWRSVSQSWYRAHSGTCDQILLPVRRLLHEICSLVSVGRPLWREDGSAFCSAITHWSNSPRTRTHTLLSLFLRLPQPGGPGFRIYVPREQGGLIIPSGTGFIRMVQFKLHLLKILYWIVK
jgi:hypothetical protein